MSLVYIGKRYFLWSLWLRVPTWGGDNIRSEPADDVVSITSGYKMKFIMVL